MTPAVGPLQVGLTAPRFTLRSQHGESVDPVGSGRVVLLVFFPFAFSAICSSELAALRDDASVFDRAGVEVVGVSCDPVYALRAMADQDGLGMSLLSDFWPHGEVTRAYGCFEESLGAPTRSSYLIDGAGVVQWGVHHDVGNARSADLHRGALLSLR